MKVFRHEKYRAKPIQQLHWWTVVDESDLKWKSQKFIFCSPTRKDPGRRRPEQNMKKTRENLFPNQVPIEVGKAFKPEPKRHIDHKQFLSTGNVYKNTWPNWLNKSWQTSAKRAAVVQSSANKKKLTWTKKNNKRPANKKKENKWNRNQAKEVVTQEFGKTTVC